MCGFTGWYQQEGSLPDWPFEKGLQAIQYRGPDDEGAYRNERVWLGHRRLSIIDPTPAGHQPMADPSGRYQIIFNGEIYNFQELKAELEQKGVQFQSGSDTEVLLHALIRWDVEALEKLNGFFAFAFYDANQHTLLLSRDRMGIKPLYYCQQGNSWGFGSELSALTAVTGAKKLDGAALLTYFQLNYIPAPLTILKDHFKLEPGTWMRLTHRGSETGRFYAIPDPTTQVPLIDYAEGKALLRERLEASVKARLIADVPLGAFLSGGIDSSIIVGLAKRHTEQLHTYSIGFRDRPNYDETTYAKLVARHFDTEHTVYSVGDSDLLESFQSLLGKLGEPFADSSSVLVHALSKHTRQAVKVALSGDGGDELFGGYYKHFGEYRVRKGGFQAALVKALYPLWQVLPKSRHKGWTNRIRQLHRFAEGAGMSPEERYWRWCGFIREAEAIQTIQPLLAQMGETEKEELFRSYEAIKQSYIERVSGRDLNGVLWADQHLVLPNDMLTKVDRMSMANGLEVRVPFLDHQVLELANQMPADWKVDGRMKKKILQETFREDLPPELFNRPKQGFEVPLVDWFRGSLKGELENKWFHPDRLANQEVVDPSVPTQLIRQLNSSDPEEAPARIYGLVVLLEWMERVGI